MSFKRRDASDFARVPASPKKTSEPRMLQNAFPRVLGGQPLQQLELPREFLSKPSEKRSTVSATVKPSNLAEVRAKLAARKSKLG